MKPNARVFQRPAGDGHPPVSDGDAGRGGAEATSERAHSPEGARARSPAENVSTPPEDELGSLGSLSASTTPRMRRRRMTATEVIGGSFLPSQIGVAMPEPAKLSSHEQSGVSERPVLNGAMRFPDRQATILSGQVNRRDHHQPIAVAKTVRIGGAGVMSAPRTGSNTPAQSSHGSNSNTGSRLGSVSDQPASVDAEVTQMDASKHGDVFGTLAADGEADTEQVSSATHREAGSETPTRGGNELVDTSVIDRADGDQSRSVGVATADLSSSATISENSSGAGASTVNTNSGVNNEGVKAGAESPVVSDDMTSVVTKTQTLYVSERGEDVMIVQKRPNVRVVKILAGKREKLIERLACEEPVDPELLETMLLMYPSFINGCLFMDMLVARFTIIPKRVTDDEDAMYFREWKRPIQEKVFQVLSEWVTVHWVDFANSAALRARLDAFLAELLANGFEIFHARLLRRVEIAFARYRRSLSLLHERRSKRDQLLQTMMVRYKAEPIEPEPGRPVTLPATVRPSGQLSIVFAANAKSFAEALTDYDYSIFVRVQPRELIVHVWPASGLQKSSAYGPSESSKATDATAGGVGENEATRSGSGGEESGAVKTVTESEKPWLDELIRRFDAESFWVATEMCSCGGDKVRADMIVRFLQIAEHCLSLNNYYSGFAVMVGLQMLPVRRMRAAWALVPERWLQHYSRLEGMMNPAGNMRLYREEFAARLQRKPNDPALPFLPLYLKDLRFICDGNPGTIESMINFDKLRMVTATVSVLVRCQRYEYRIKRRHELYESIRESELFVEHDMERLFNLAAESHRCHEQLVQGGGTRRR
jgi:hypothetical protein